MKLRNMIFMSLFAAIVAVLGFFPPIPLPFLPVPITLQTLGVMLTGGILGAKRGGITMFLFITLVAIGAPLLSGGRGGLGVVFGPTGGYIFSFPIVAFLIGFFTEKILHQLKLWKMALIQIVFGVLVINVCGITYLSFIAETPWLATATSALVFLPGDIIKAIVASIITIKLIQTYPLIETNKKVA